MKNKNEILFFEDKIERDQDGRITFHPLINIEYGFQMYGMTEPIPLEGINVFRVEFFRNDEYKEGEPWADPLRALVLERLRYKDWSWYLSFIGGLRNMEDYERYSEEVEEEIQKDFLGEENLGFTFIKTVERYNSVHSRLFIEVPDHLVASAVHKYWPRASRGYPIFGMKMAPGQIDRIKKWGEKPFTIELFMEMIDQVFVAFYTYTEENQHFLFLTNKFTLEMMKDLIQFDDLQMRAGKIG